ncbi:MAG: DUF2059 domain-containing protein [Terriglobales bacterium]
MKTRLVIVCFLLIGSLFAQTKSPSDVPAKPGSRPESASGIPKLDGAKRADISRLMELEGTKAVIDQMVDGLEKNMKPLMANALPPGEYREKLIDLFFAKFNSKIAPQQLVDLALPIYDKYYSDAEIKDLIKFYETPLGQKLSSVRPQMVVELEEAGQKWGEGLGRDSMVEVLAEHPELAAALNAAAKGTQAK